MRPKYLSVLGSPLSFLASVILSAAVLPMSTAYVLPSAAETSYLTRTAQRPLSALASKVIFESPSMSENLYKDFIVTSRPLNLRKYGNGTKKQKKTKKDSKIYFIPVPAQPYRFIPGVGYDYQPTQIKPIFKDAPAPVPVDQWVGGSSNKNHYQQNQFQDQQPQTSLQYPQHLPKDPETQPQQPQPHFSYKPHVSSPQPAKQNILEIVPLNPDDSKQYRLQQNNYYFNGRPFRLQVAHASPKHGLTAKNLKSKFYFNKKIIY